MQLHLYLQGVHSYTANCLQGVCIYSVSISTAYLCLYLERVSIYIYSVSISKVCLSLSTACLYRYLQPVYIYSVSIATVCL